MWLVLETSTSLCSLAVMDDARVLREGSWKQDRTRPPQLFTVLRRVLADSGLSLGVIDAFIVGLGPGAFSSLRMAVSAAQAMALPDCKPVIGISSAEAMARNVSMQNQVDSATVVGNARRERFWVSRYRVQNPDSGLEGGFQLVSAEELPACLEDATFVMSPDWDALETLLRRAVSGPTRLLEHAAVPVASAVGAMAFARFGSSPESLTEASKAGQPLSPIYLHPSVTAKTRT